MKTTIKNLNPAKLYLLAAFAVLLAINTSCRKDTYSTPVQSGATKDLVAPSDFKWSTSKEITVTITGLQDVNPLVSNTLYIKSANGVTYYKDLLFMNQNYSLTLTVPVTETSLVLVYGSKTKTFDILSGSITYDYITE